MMEILDAGVCLGARDGHRHVVSRQRLLEVMDTYHIDRAVAWHEYALLDPRAGNEQMYREAGAAGGRLLVCVVLDPALGAENLPGEGSLTQRLRELAPAAVRVFPENVRTVFHPFYWGEILEACNELGLRLIIDGGYDNGFFRDLPAITAQYPKIRFVLTGYGLCRSRHVVPLLRQRKNLYCTMEQMMDHMQIEQMAELGLDGQLLFASNYPAVSPAGALGLALYAEISHAARSGILHENWEAMTK